MGWARLYHDQRQAQQLREIERNTAAAAGVKPRKLNWTERRVMGVKDPERTADSAPPPQPQPKPQAHEAQVRADQRVADLEGRVASLEARLQRAFDAIELLQQEGSPGASSQ